MDRKKPTIVDRISVPQNIDISSSADSFEKKDYTNTSEYNVSKTSLDSDKILGVSKKYFWIGSAVLVLGIGSFLLYKKFKK